MTLIIFGRMKRLLSDLGAALGIGTDASAAIGPSALAATTQDSIRDPRFRPQMRDVSQIPLFQDTAVRPRLAMALTVPVTFSVRMPAIVNVVVNSQNPILHDLSPSIVLTFI